MKKWMPLALIVLLLAGGCMWKSGLLRIGAEEARESLDTAHPYTLLIEKTGKEPVFLEFVSASCSWCKKMEPSVYELKKAYGDRINFIVANTSTDEEAQKLAYFYKVQGVPTVIILDTSGKTVERLVGYQEREELEKALRKVLP